MDFFGPDTAPFAIALCVTVGIAVVEGVALLFGLSASHAIDGSLPDLEVDLAHPEVPHAEAGVGPLSEMLSWLSFGRVPALVVLILFASSFGVLGFLTQGLSQSLFGNSLSPWLAGIPALLGAAFATRHGGRLLARIVPREESDAVSTSAFIGRIATVIRGEARPGRPAEAKLRDIHGKTHYLLVQPEGVDEVFGEGSEVVIVRQSGGVYDAIVKLQPL